MSKKFTVITKDGSKWLRPVNPFDNNDPRFTSKEPFCILGMRPCSKTVCECDEWKKFEKNNPILPYIGYRPEGTSLSEEQVTIIQQVRTPNTVWRPYAGSVTSREETRIAYTDAEPHDSHVSKFMPLVKLCADEMREVEYWKKRTEAAEKLIGISPSDPKTYDEFYRIREEWEQIVKQEPK